MSVLQDHIDEVIDSLLEGAEDEADIIDRIRSSVDVAARARGIDTVEVIRIVFTTEDVKDEISQVDENRGADGDPPLDHDKAFADVLEWASAIQDAATERMYESLSNVIATGQA